MLLSLLFQLYSHCVQLYTLSTNLAYQRLTFHQLNVFTYRVDFTLASFLPYGYLVLSKSIWLASSCIRTLALLLLPPGYTAKQYFRLLTDVVIATVITHILLFYLGQGQG